MSLATWKKEFYKTPADKVSKGYALRHSIKKWTGLLSKNRRKHGLSFCSGTLMDNDGEEFFMGSKTCALCFHNDCHDCPVPKRTGQECHSVYFKMINHNRVSPMINLLKRALTKRKPKCNGAT